MKTNEEIINDITKAFEQEFHRNPSAYEIWLIENSVSYTIRHGYIEVHHYKKKKKRQKCEPKIFT